MIQLSHLYMTTEETVALTMWIFVGKVMSLLFNMLFRIVIAFLPWSKHLLISWLQSLSAVILEPKKRKSITASTFPPSISHKMMRPNVMILVFWMLSFKPAFILCFTLIKRLFSFSSFPTIRMISSACLRLMLLQAILIPACESPSLAFHMMYSTYKLKNRITIYSVVIIFSQFWTSQ